MSPILDLRRLSVAAVVAVMIVALLPATASASVGAPVVIDSFAGQTFGARTVTLEPSGGSTTTNGASFTTSGGNGVVVTGANGNTAGAATLTWTSPTPVDLTAEGSNTQLLLELASVQRTDPPNDWESAGEVSFTVISSAGVSTYASIGVPNLFAHNIALPFACGGGPCFTPQPNWGSVTAVSARIAHPKNYDGARQTTWVIDQLRATPTGGIAPAAPSTTVYAPAATMGPAGSSINFNVSFTAGGLPAPVTATPMTDDGLRASDVTTTGTAGGAYVESVTGGPSPVVVVATQVTFAAAAVPPRCPSLGTSST